MIDVVSHADGHRLVPILVSDYVGEWEADQVVWYWCLFSDLWCYVRVHDDYANVVQLGNVGGYNKENVSDWNVV